MNNFECKTCGQEVKLVNNTYIRSCSCKDSPIVANMTATAYGESRMMKNTKKAK